MRLRVPLCIILSVMLFCTTAWAGLSKTQISQLYTSIFDRASEGEGNTYWQNQPAMGAAAAAMLDTQAAKDYFGASLNTNQAFIEHIYQNTLNKTVADDPNGIAYWVNQLNTRQRGDVVAELVSVIEDYAPGGPYYEPEDTATVNAYNQFVNRVTVSNYMADAVVYPPTGWEIITRLGSLGLGVTYDAVTVDAAKAFIDENFKSSSNAVVVGTSVDLSSLEIQPTGNMITIDTPSHPLNGMEITVPPGCYSNTVPFKISAAPVQSHTLGSLFKPLTPMITVKNGGQYSEKSMIVKIPVNVPENHFAMAFYYDDTKGTLEPMQLISSDAESVTVATRHFSDFIVTGVAQSVLDSYLAEGIQSGFYPGVDDWSFINRGSYIAPGGHCAGQSLGALWYYTAKPEGDLPLWGSYDNNFRDWTTPDLWQDDSSAYRFCSVLQKDIGWDDFANKFWSEAQGQVWRLVNNQWKLVEVPGIGAEGTRNMFALSMLLTHEPQFVAIYSSSGGGHAMIVYAVTRDALHIADPNYPGDINRTIYFSNGSFSPYPSGDDWDEISAGRGKNYETILYMAKSNLMPWENIAQRWEEVKNGTIGNGIFPNYQIFYLDEDTGKYKTLSENQRFTKNKADFAVSGEGSASFTIYKNSEILPFDSAWKTDLIDGDNLLGFHVMGEINNNSEYVDFVYVNVIYETEASEKTLGISISPKSSDTPSSYPTIFGGNFDLPITITASGQITYDFTRRDESSNNEIRVHRIWGTGSYDGTLLTLDGSWTCEATGGGYSGYLTQNDFGTFSLQTRGYWDEPLAQTHATSTRVTEYETLESPNQTAYFTVDDLHQLD